jgi:hypothetical protein
VDENTLLPIKIETWTMDVQAKNPEFVLDHELTQHYDLQDLSPKSFEQLANKLLHDKNLALKYNQTTTQHGPMMLTTCDKQCMRNAYC